MNIKALRLDVEAMFSQIMFGHGYLHYGYWDSDAPERATLIHLGQAQEAYFNKILQTIPQDTRSILDIGSGTGSNAYALTERGYTVDCVCPSAKLNIIAKSKLSDRSIVHECRFEDFKATDRSYDLVLFAESFHYIDAREALQNALKLSCKYIIIFDYFRVHPGTKGDRINVRQFYDILREFDDLEIIENEDVTSNISKTFQVTDDISNEYIKPFAIRLIDEFRAARPFLYFIFWPIVKKIRRYALTQSERRTRFVLEREYRMILLKKK